MPRSPSCKRTRPERFIVLSACDRLPGVRPVVAASSRNHAGCISAICASSAQLRFDVSLEKLFGEVNHTLRSLGLARS